MKHHQNPLIIFETPLNRLKKKVIRKDCMRFIIMHGALLLQTLTDSERKQHEE